MLAFREKAGYTGYTRHIMKIKYRYLNGQQIVFNH